jgi:hypothetical protein
MINLDEKKYYIYGGFGLAAILIAITLFSFFSAPRYEVLDASNTLSTNTVGAGATKGYFKPKVVSVADISAKSNYSIKLTKPSGLPTAVQEVIDSDFSKKKLAFIKKYSNEPSVILTNDQFQVYQSGKYVSVTTTFLEYKGSEVVTKESSCWTYDQDTEAIVSLPQVLESDDKAYVYLSTTIKSLVLSSLAERTGVTISEITDLNKKIDNILTADSQNYSKWYLDGNQLVFMFDISLFLDTKAEEQKIILDFNMTKTNLKVKTN